MALALLEHEGRPVSEVAAQVGYPRVCNFTTAFTKLPSSVSPWRTATRFMGCCRPQHQVNSFTDQSA